MQLDVRQLRAALVDTNWWHRTRDFAAALRAAGQRPGRLLIVGTPDYEPWHFTAHLTDAARFSGQPQLAPTLLRHDVPLGAPAHLAVDLSYLRHAANGATVLVVAPTAAPAGLLNRVDDARRAGATILAVDSGDRDLHELAHEALTVADDPNQQCNRRIDAPGAAFDTTMHLLTVCATDPDAAADRHPLRLRRGNRSR